MNKHSQLVETEIGRGEMDNEILKVSFQTAWVALQVFGGLLLADFVSGILHWLEDRYGGPKWPIVGGVIRSTIRHHKRPRRMLSVPFLTRNGLTFSIALGFLAVFALMGWINAFTLTAVAIGAFANEFHAWAHASPRENGPVISWLQARSLIISHGAHAKHHRGKKNTHYCAVNDWMNGPLEHVRFWRRIEAVLKAWTRLRPRRDPTVNRRHRRSRRSSLLQKRVFTA